LRRFWNHLWSPFRKPESLYLIPVFPKSAPEAGRGVAGKEAEAAAPEAGKPPDDREEKRGINAQIFKPAKPANVPGEVAAAAQPTEAAEAAGTETRSGKEVLGR